MYKYIFVFFIVAFFVILIIVYFNLREIYPTHIELEKLQKLYGDLNIDDTEDIIKVQNKTIKYIKHSFVSLDRINIINSIESRKGFCYDRSLILQKLLMHNDIPIRPVYLFYYNDGKDVDIFDFFNPKINSHSVFEFKWKDKWYMMRTNTSMDSLITLSEYLISNTYVPTNTRYIRHLNNRNSRFIFPSWLPDIY